MRSRFWLNLIEIIITLALNIDLIYCLPTNSDFELDITENILNSKDILIDISKINKIDNNHHIKILFYEEELELYSAKYPNKKINKGDFLQVHDKFYY